MKIAVLTTALLLLAATGAEAKIALLGPSGAKGKLVRKDLANLIAPIDSVMTEDDLARGQKPPKGARARNAWLAKLAEGTSDLLLRAELRGRKLKLTATSQGSAVGVQEVNLTARFLVGPEDRQTLTAWFKEVLEAARSRQDKEAAALSGLAKPHDEPIQPPKENLGSEEPGSPPAAPSGEMAHSGEPTSAEVAIERESDPEAPGLLGGSLGLPRGSPPLFFVQLDLEGVNRGFGYHDPLSNNLRPYSAGLLPTIGGRVEFYPLALTKVSALAPLGFFAGFHRSFGSSKRDGGPSFPTSNTEIDLGGLYRASLGPVILSPFGGFHIRNFTLGAAADGTKETEFPDFNYRGLALGMGLDLGLFSGVSLTGQGDYTVVFSAGQVISPTFHKKGSVGAVGAALGVRFALAKDFDAEVSGRYQHYFFSFAPEVGDTFIAGGALDQFVTVRGSIRVAL